MNFPLLCKTFAIPNSQLVKAFAHFGGAQAFLEAHLEDIEPCLDKTSYAKVSQWRRTNCLPKDYEQMQILSEDMQINTLTLGDSNYPRMLAEIPDPPAVLFVKGNIEYLSLPQVAVVGARKSTVQGKQLAHEFAEQLAMLGFGISSGLALGIDAAAHQGAMAVGGYTNAIMGSGIDQMYPAEHESLAKQIVSAGGSLVSEFLPLSRPRVTHFPQRNRIIAGLSLGVLVVEAGTRSGSLITARLAVEQGREVFAVPGSLMSPLSAGCNQLIRDGATLVTCPEQIVAELQAFSGFHFLEHGLVRKKTD